MRHWSFTLKLALCGGSAGFLLVAAVHLAMSARPVSAAVIVVLAIMALVATRRLAAKADTSLTEILLQLEAGSDDQPTAPGTAFPRLHEAIQSVARVHAQRRQALDQRLTEQAAMLDCVPVALFEMALERDVTPLNQAGRRLTGGRTPIPLEQLLLTDDMVSALTGMRPGQQRLLQLADSRAVLAGMTVFTPAGMLPRQLLALQLVNEDLSVIELNAWQGMARVLSHELMNSLAPVISLAESLAAMAAASTLDNPQEVEETSSLIGRRAMHVMKFVERYQEILDLPEPEIAAVKMRDLVDDLACLTRALPGSRIVITEVDPPGLVGHFDRALIEQGLLNILKNAAEATAGQLDAEVRIICRSNNTDITIDIVDNGPGLSEVLEEVLVPFFTTKEGGSGIGLTIARRIALAHGGKLKPIPYEDGAWLRLEIPYPQLALKQADLNISSFETRMSEPGPNFLRGV